MLWRCSALLSMLLNHNYHCLFHFTRESLLGTIYIMLIALPGYWFAIAFIDSLGRYWMQQMGFAMCVLWFSVLAAGYNGSSGLGYTAAASAGFVLVYGFTYFFSNFGPNSTTFLMAGVRV